jgi:hypothetical protein
VSWGTVKHNFIKTFSFESENPWVDIELHRIKNNIFEKYGVDTLIIYRFYKK